MTFADDIILPKLYSFNFSGVVVYFFTLFNFKKTQIPVVAIDIFANYLYILRESVVINNVGV